MDTHLDMHSILLLVTFFSHLIVYLLSFVGLLIRALQTSYDFLCRRQPSSMPASAVVWCLRRTVLFLYPWIYLWDKPPPDITRTPFRSPKSLLIHVLLVHTLWLTSSVGLWALSTLASVKEVLPFISPAFGPITDPEFRVVVLILMVIYAGVFAASSSLMWLLSLGGSLVHLRRMNSVRDGGDLDDARHYLAPFRKATVWAFASLPIFLGYAVLSLASHPYPFG